MIAPLVGLGGDRAAAEQQQDRELKTENDQLENRNSRGKDQ